ncbi:hypothetical protein E4U53_005548 [Claviceps sorghi]|nr:hypothetical protein E4U53_005548 [Claviceps sorghi]
MSSWRSALEVNLVSALPGFGAAPEAVQDTAGLLLACALSLRNAPNTKHRAPNHSPNVTPGGEFTNNQFHAGYSHKGGIGSRSDEYLKPDVADLKDLRLKAWFHSTTGSATGRGSTTGSGVASATSTGAAPSNAAIPGAGLAAILAIGAYVF